jgi:hypothetical protein
MIIAPPETRWAERGERELRNAGRLITRLYYPTLLPLFVSSGGVSALAIDTRLAVTSMRVIVECKSTTPPLRVVLVHEDDEAVVLDTIRSVSWPSTVEGVLSLFDS